MRLIGISVKNFDRASEILGKRNSNLLHWVRSFDSKLRWSLRQQRCIKWFSRTEFLRTNHILPPNVGNGKKLRIQSLMFSKNDTVICYIRNGERGDSFLETAFARIQNSEHTRTGACHSQNITNVNHAAFPR